MPQLWYPEISVDDGADTYYASIYGQNRLEYKTNGGQMAVITLDNTAGAVNLSTLAVEDRVQVYVADPATPSTRYEMLDGYIISIDRSKDPGGRKLVTLTIVDYIGYLAAKSIYEFNYWTDTVVDEVVEDAASQISGITTTGVDSFADTIRRDFFGTSVKDVFAYCGEFADAEWFGFETLDLQFFASGSRLLQTGGNTYKIWDNSGDLISTTQNIKLLGTRQYGYKQDVTEKFRTVGVTSGIVQTFPTISSLNLLQTAMYHHDIYGKDFSSYIYPVGQSTYNIHSPTSNQVKPCVPDTTGLNVNGGSVPAMKIQPSAVGNTFGVTIQTTDQDPNNTGTLTQQPWRIPIDTFQELRMFLQNSLATATMTDLEMRLQDAVAGGYWAYKIKHNGGAYLDGTIIAAYNDLITNDSPAGTGYSFVRYNLPTSTSNSMRWNLQPANWYKVLSPTHVDFIQFIYTPTSGYTGSFNFGQVHFYTRLRSRVTGAGTPATEKIIVDRSIKDMDSLTNRATKEQQISNVTATRGSVSIVGHSDFKRPGYNINIDFSNTLSTGASGAVRMDKIIHQLTPLWTTTIEFNNAYQRL